MRVSDNHGGEWNAFLGQFEATELVNGVNNGKTFGLLLPDVVVSQGATVLPCNSPVDIWQPIKELGCEIFG
ncbi:hypothetical protein Tco_1150350 [Tanacetum coccineum]